MSTAAAGNTVRVHYTGTLTDGTVFDSSAGRDPLQFTIGSHEVIPGFESGVTGMALNEKKRLNIAAADAYGERRDDLLFNFPRTELPAGFEPRQGQQLQMRNEKDFSFMVTVSEISDDHLVLDANHPLAGKDLTFDIELVEIVDNN